MVTSIHSSLSCLLPFIPSLYSLFLNRKIFHLLVSFLFLDAHYIIMTFLFYSLRNIYIALGYLLLFLCAVLFNCLVYAWQLSLLQFANMGTFIATIANMGQL